MMETVSDAVICVSMNLMAASRARICSAGCMDERSKNIAIEPAVFQLIGLEARDLPGGASHGRRGRWLPRARRVLSVGAGTSSGGQSIAIQMLQLEDRDRLRLAVLEQRELILLQDPRLALPLLSFTATLMMTRFVLVLKVGAVWSCASKPTHRPGRRTVDTKRGTVECSVISLKTEPDVDVGRSHGPRRGGQAVKRRSRPPCSRW